MLDQTNASVHKGSKEVEATDWRGNLLQSHTWLLAKVEAVIFASPAIGLFMDLGKYNQLRRNVKEVNHTTVIQMVNGL